MWPRAIEPRLSVATEWHPCRNKGNGKHLVADVQCAEVTTASVCDAQVIDTAQAEKAVAFRSPCLDRAITYLQKTSRRNAAAMNELAAAYYVRAQRDDRASDLLRALEAADQAVAIRPTPPGTHFNRALILESLGLTREAIASWESAGRMETGNWAREARSRHDALLRTLASSGERQWELNRGRIAAALASHRADAIVPLIAHYPTPAEHYFEDELFPQASLADLRTFAEALSRVCGDRYAIDCVAALEKPANRKAVKEGQRLLRKADAEGFVDVDRGARDYEVAARQLDRGGSPLALTAWLGATADYGRQSEPKWDLIIAIARDVAEPAVKHGYLRIAARARAMTAYALLWEGRYIEALADDDEALAIYQHLRNEEGIADTQARRLGILRVLGQDEQAWRDALPFVRASENIIDTKTRHLLLGETTSIVMKLQCPRSALDYINDEISHLEQDLVAANPDKHRIAEAEKQIAIAKRSRAEVELQLERLTDARNDIAEAVRLAKDAVDPTQLPALEARIDEVEGESLLKVDPNRAAAILQKAANVSGSEYSSFRIALLAERAEALRRARHGREAEATMVEAIRQLQKEESRTMAQRGLHAEPTWNGYFDRFRQAYDLLIRQLIENGHDQEAFAYNDQAHGSEPLDLILKSGLAPAAVRDLAAAPAATLLPKLQACLPADTFLVEYRLLDDAAYAWVVSRSGFRPVQLQTRRADVEAWTSSLQDAAAAENSAAFGNGLYTPYEKLIAAPLQAVAEMSKGAAVRLVIVPDEFMHGLPFAALRDRSTDRYLIERCPVSIAGSGALYAFSLLRDAAIAHSPASALVIGDPAFDRAVGAGATRLPAARDEADSLRRFYAPVEELIDREATPARFLRDAAKHLVIHIAAHAIANGEASSESYLLLAAGRADRGVLDARRLQNALHLPNTCLVVLGACHSGGSVTVGPQGVAPLVRPFLGAGVPGVIATLWNIDDATAKTFLVSFHRHYRLGSDAAAALRATQIELLKTPNPGLRSELAWAAYQAIGFASSPTTPAREMKKEKPP